MSNCWINIERGMLWLLLITLPWQMRIILAPVFRHEVFLEHASIALYLTDILIICLIANWVILSLINRWKIIYGPKTILYLVGSFIVWIWISLLINNFNGNLDNPSNALWIAGKITIFGLFYLYLINRIRNIKEIILAVTVGVLLQSVIAIGQYFSNHSLGLSLLDESVLDPIIIGIPVVLKDGFRQLRAHGLTPHANVLGGYLSIGLLLITTRLSQKKNYWMCFVFLVGVAGLFLSFSRMAWIVFLLGIISIFIYWFRYKLVDVKRILREGGVALVLISILIASQYSAVLPRLTVDQDIEQKSLIEREQQLTEFKIIYDQNKIFGTGIGQYVINNIKHMEAKGITNDYPQPVHNVFLLVLVELGVPGLILFVMLLLGTLVVLWKTKPAHYKVVLITSWLGIIALGITDHYVWDLQQGKLMFWLVLALIGITGYNEKYGRRE